MRAGLDRREVELLAKTMEVKFTISGPPIGGAKSGICFDPADPRREEVLRRWFRAVAPLLKTYYGTGGDLNVDEMHDVIPLTERYGLWHPQEGVVSGHFRPSASELIQKVGQLRLGVAKPVENARFTPAASRKHTIADLITGWGVAESVRHFYDLYGGELAGKRVLVQGWGNVGSAAAYYLAQAGARIVGIIDRAEPAAQHLVAPRIGRIEVDARLGAADRRPGDGELHLHCLGEGLHLAPVQPDAHPCTAAGRAAAQRVDDRPAPRAGLGVCPLKNNLQRLAFEGGEQVAQRRRLLAGSVIQGKRGVEHDRCVLDLAWGSGSGQGRCPRGTALLCQPVASGEDREPGGGDIEGDAGLRVEGE